MRWAGESTTPTRRSAVSGRRPGVSTTTRSVRVRWAATSRSRSGPGGIATTTTSAPSASGHRPPSNSGHHGRRTVRPAQARASNPAAHSPVRASKVMPCCSTRTRGRSPGGQVGAGPEVPTATRTSCQSEVGMKASPRERVTARMARLAVSSWTSRLGIPRLAASRLASSTRYGPSQPRQASTTTRASSPLPLASGSTSTTATIEPWASSATRPTPPRWRTITNRSK